MKVLNMRGFFSLMVTALGTSFISAQATASSIQVAEGKKVIIEGEHPYYADAKIVIKNDDSRSGNEKNIARKKVIVEGEHPYYADAKVIVKSNVKGVGKYNISTDQVKEADVADYL